MRVNNRLILIPIIIIGLLFFGFFLKNFSDQNKQKTIKAKIRSVELILDVADTDELWSRGLSGKESLGYNRGMIFIFPEKKYHTFWMNGMKFPLDFIWIEDSIIKDITVNVPPPKNGDSSDIATVKPGNKINKVIEVSAGTTDRLNIQIGDNIIFEN